MVEVLSERRKQEMRKTRTDLIGLFFEMPSEPNPFTSELKPEPKPRRFSYLVEHSGLTEAGLSKILKELIRDGLLKKDLDENQRPIYMPVEIEIEKAQGTIWHISNELQEQRSNKALYWHGGDYPGRLNFGLSMDLVSNKDIPANVQYGLAREIEDHAFKLITSNFRDNKQTVEEYGKGKSIFAVEVDWQKFSDNLGKIQAFIDDINAHRDIFSDDRLDFHEESDNLSILYLLVRFSPLFGDKIFEKNLRKFLEKSTDNYELFDIIRINPKLFDEFMKCVDNNLDPLDDERLSKYLLTYLGVELHDNNFSKCIMAGRIFRYNDTLFLKKLDELEVKSRDKIRTALIKSDGKWRRKKYTKVKK